MTTQMDIAKDLNRLFEEPQNTFDLAFKKSYRPIIKKNPKNVKAKLIELMEERALWLKDMENDLTINFVKYKNFLFIKEGYFTHPNWTLSGNLQWQFFAILYDVKNIAQYGRINNDELRTPQTRLVFGTDRWVKMKDNQIFYTWEFDKVMFCKGNAVERHRIGSLNCRGKIVVDMFAGLGYFTLPYLVHAKAEHVYACDLNIHAVEALLKNLKLNRVAEKCTVLHGDVLKTCPEGKADHVNLGLIPNCEKFWEKGTQALKECGGVLHIHGVVTTVHNAIGESPSCCLGCIFCYHKLKEAMKTPLALNEIVNKSCNIILRFTNEGIVDIQVSENNLDCCWRKIEYLKWGIHVAHTIGQYLINYRGGTWQLSIEKIYKVKDFSPHRAHLVIDVACCPV